MCVVVVFQRGRTTFGEHTNKATARAQSGVVVRVADGVETRRHHVWPFGMRATLNATANRVARHHPLVVGNGNATENTRAVGRAKPERARVRRKVDARHHTGARRERMRENTPTWIANAFRPIARVIG